MRLEELLKDERIEGRAEGRAEGKAEAILDILSDLGEIPEDIRKRIMSEKDITKIQIWLKAAIRAESMEQFIQKIR